MFECLCDVCRRGANLSTDGIDLDYWNPFEEDKGKAPVAFNIWDFGGQEGKCDITFKVFLCASFLYICAVFYVYVCTWAYVRVNV